MWHITPEIILRNSEIKAINKALEIKWARAWERVEATHKRYNIPPSESLRPDGRIWRKPPPWTYDEVVRYEMFGALPTQEEIDEAYSLL